MYEDYKAQGFYLIAAWPHSIAQWDDWYNTTGLDRFTNYYYDNAGIYGAYAAQFGWAPGTPRSVLIDREGNGRLVATDVPPEATWRAAIQELL